MKRPTTLERVRALCGERIDEQLALLTPREEQVLRLFIAGESAKRIGVSFQVSPGSIYLIRKCALDKLKNPPAARRSGCHACGAPLERKYGYHCASDTVCWLKREEQRMLSFAGNYTARAASLRNLYQAKERGAANACLVVPPPV